jgi:hypothetical protein
MQRRAGAATSLISREIVVFRAPRAGAGIAKGAACALQTARATRDLPRVSREPVMRTTVRSIATLFAASFFTACIAPTGSQVDDRSSEPTTEAVSVDPIDPADPTDPVTPPVPFGTLCSSYANYDMNGDGTAEINSLKLMSFEPATAPAGTNGMVVVFVDPRVLADFTGSRKLELSLMLQNWRQDLLNEGFTTRFVEASVYSGPLHQDGLTVLAMRRFLKAVRTNYPSLRGTVLFGAFPETSLVHSTLRKNHGDTTLTTSTGDVKYTDVDYLEMHPNRINASSDLVLGDLDGNWEALYHQATVNMPYWTMIPSVSGTWPVADQRLITSKFEYWTAPWADVFHISDAQYYIVSHTDSQLDILIRSPDPKNAELTTADQAFANPIARPEIVVSRINAKHLAFEPTAPVDKNGNTLVKNGQAQDLVYDGYAPSVQWVFDARLEQRILIDYLYRNSAFRHTVDHALPFITSAVRADNPGLPSLIDPGTINSFLQRAATFAGSYSKDSADLAEYFTYLRHPAVLRGIEAHSDTKTSVFAEPSDPATLVAALGGKPWMWDRTTTSTQTFLTASTSGDRAKYQLYRALWESKALKDAGQSFYIHGGCDLTLPAASDVNPYDSPEYGKFQNGESILFFANGLALYGRGKVFNDKADGFPDGIKAATPGYFGRGWRAQFMHDAADGSLASQPYGRKKAYYWTMMGDWTLRLRY